jgi:hypothetical protein
VTTDESARLHLYERARDAMDDDAARTLMSALPWDVAELATKQDLAMLKKDLIGQIERVARATVMTLIVAIATMLAAGAALAGAFG